MVARQTVVMQSWVRIWHLPNPQLTANLLVGCTWDGTWLRANVCEGQQRRIEPMVCQKQIEKKIISI
jgi:hypothetical protein